MTFKTAPPYQEYVLDKFGGLYTEADPRDLPGGASPLCHDVDFQIGGVRIRPGLSSTLTSPSGNLPFYFKSFFMNNLAGRLFQDNAGKIYYESGVALGTWNLLYSGLATHSLSGAPIHCISETINGMEFICLSDLFQGADQPRLFLVVETSGIWCDRISQVGPGAGPEIVFSQPTQYGIVSINEVYAPFLIWHIVWGAYMIDATPPLGNNIFFLFAPGSTGNIKDLQVGDIVNIYGGYPIGLNQNGTYRVASMGIWDSAKYAGQEEYFSVVSDQINGQGSLTALSGFYYQKTTAVIQLSTPIPQQDAVIGAKITISGSSKNGWNETWDIQDVPSTGQLLITNTVLAGGVATYTFSPVSGNPPSWQGAKLYVVGATIVDGSGHVYQVTIGGVSGGSAPAFGGATVVDNEVTWTIETGAVLPVTVFNCNNGNGIFNIQNQPITSTSGNTFTVAISSADVGSASESGEAVSGLGSAIVIDPGIPALNTGHPGINPIIGNATGGFATPPQTIDLAPGERYAICMFLTRTGFISSASPPVQFFTNGNTSNIIFSNLPVGPANVIIGRIIAITAANAGVGGPYFYIPDDVILQSSESSLGQVQTVNKTIVNDNTSTTTGVLNITDTVLLQSINVTEVGNNMLQTRELGECVKAIEFGSRVVYMGERLKNDQFVNLTFDGGSIGGVPAGWTIDSGSATLATSDIYGQSCVLNGTISQPAYETSLKTPIMQPGIGYWVYITAKGSGTVSIGGIGTFSAAVSSAILREFVGEIAGSRFVTVPANLRLTVTGSGVTIDRIEIWSVNSYGYSQLAVSYANNPQSIDAITGGIDISQFTSEAITNVFRFLDSLYVTTLHHVFQVQEADGEPSTWTIRESSNRTGCIGPLAADVGEEYIVSAGVDGIYIFDGGNHIKISQEIQTIWDSLTWTSMYWEMQTVSPWIWVKNDISKQRIMVGVIMATPNQWLPHASSYSDTRIPNVILVCSYLGMPNGTAIAEADPVIVSAFTGHLLFRDKKRKWTIWQIPSNFANFIFQYPFLSSKASTTLQICSSSVDKIYELAEEQTFDDTQRIPERYMTFGFSDHEVEQQLQIGSVRKLFPYLTALLDGSGSVSLTIYPESPSSAYSSTQAAFSLSDPATDDTNIPLNETGNRLFLDFNSNAGSAGSIVGDQTVNPIVLYVAKPALPLADGDTVTITGGTGNYTVINGTWKISNVIINTDPLSSTGWQFSIPVSGVGLGAINSGITLVFIGGYFGLKRLNLAISADPRMRISGV